MKPSITGVRKSAAAAIAIAAALTLTPASAAPLDLDGDGIPNIVDPDVDGDGIPNGLDDNVDGGICLKPPFKGKFVGDRLNNDNPREKDIDGDGFADDSKRELDIDGDGRKDDSAREKDIDGDRRKDHSARERDIDGDERSDSTDRDIDGDGIKNREDDDCDGDGKSDDDDEDDDGDGIPDESDDDDNNDSILDDDDLEVEIALQATSSAPSGSRVRAEIKRLPSGKIELDFDGRNLATGSYDIVIDGQTLGQLIMVRDGRRTEGEVEFETNPNESDELPLPFNPIGLTVEIVQDGTIYFTGTIPDPGTTNGGGGDDDDVDDDNGGAIPVTVSLTKGSGLSSEAEGSLEVEFGSSGVTSLEVEVEEIPAGDYDFLVGGVKRGTLVVYNVKGRLRGELNYEKSPDDSDEILLDFPVAGEPVLISQGATTFFSGIAPTAS
jgi:hypothetical protein